MLGVIGFSEAIEKNKRANYHTLKIFEYFLKKLSKKFLIILQVLLGISLDSLSESVCALWQVEL